MSPSEQDPMVRRQSSTHHYHTFTTSPPKSRGRPLSSETTSSLDAANSHNQNGDDNHEKTPLPTRQLTILAVIALCEQTALNSISPYLPHMASSFPDVESDQVGVYVGTIASAFALAQFATNFFWGWLSDRVGRKPVVLVGTILTAGCFVAFGFCRTLWQAIVVQAIMGTVNGNQGVVSTCLGEITDRSNQSRAFTYLPVIYGIGAITGPIVGGLLVNQNNPVNRHYPYLCPNLVSAAILLVDFVLTIIFLDESLEDASTLPAIGKKIRDMFTRIWQFTSSTRPSYLRSHPSSSYRRAGYSGPQQGYEESSDVDSETESVPHTANRPLFGIRHSHEELSRDEVLNKDIVLLLLSYLIFALANVSFNSLYPIFAQAPPPTGRQLSPGEIGFSLSFAGVVTIIFQVGMFGRLRDKMGNKSSYRAGLFGFVVSFMLMPFVGYKDQSALDGKLSKDAVILGAEVCFVLLIKTVASVGGLTSALLLVGHYEILFSLWVVFCPSILTG